MIVERSALQPGLQAFGGYELDFAPAAGAPAEQLVIAVTGLRRAGEPITGFDFHASLMARPGIDRLFLRDQRQSWYNAEDGWAALAAALRGQVAAGGYARVTVLGVSMGAFGALLVGALLPEARVVALCPPVSVDLAKRGPAIIRYQRWFADDQPALRPDAVMSGDPKRFLCLFGDLDVIDVANAEAFHAEGWPQVFICPDGGHELGAFLKQAGRFNRVLDRLLEGAPLTAVAAAAGAYLAFSHCQAFAMLAARRHLYAGERAAADRFLHDARQAPTAPVPRSLTLLGRLREALAPPGRDTLAQFLAAANQSVPMATVEGWEAELLGLEARAMGHAVQAGPLALLRLRPTAPPDGGLDSIGRLRLRLRFALPPAGSAVAAPEENAISAFWAEPGGKPRLLARAEDPAKPLLVDVPFRQGEALLLLQRASFYSLFDAGTGALRAPWSMRLYKLTLKPLPARKAA
ncbi:hypothetical protein BKE38_14525 [Pseudoroseomonas deserti]|uniref:Alpha/beta hydrolase n=1 Tax=Teichococcus deserti TaxID=1817963 RepID=A0A1V2H0T2_9PROT|nr:hypothetical protein [Pseudoroseomonas deserti]ONG52453.1 hypothetical protein BKE38_14525 [Pseudoroseomonas deserti]